MDFSDGLTSTNLSSDWDDANKISLFNLLFKENLLSEEESDCNLLLINLLKLLQAKSSQ